MHDDAIGGGDFLAVGFQFRGEGGLGRDLFVGQNGIRFFSVEVVKDNIVPVLPEGRDGGLGNGVVKAFLVGVNQNNG